MPAFSLLETGTLKAFGGHRAIGLHTAASRSVRASYTPEAYLQMLAWYFFL